MTILDSTEIRTGNGYQFLMSNCNMACRGQGYAMLPALLVGKAKSDYFYELRGVWKV